MEEAKLVAALLIGVGLLAGGGVLGFKVAASHYEAELLKQSEADNQALAQAEARRLAAEHQAEQDSAAAHDRFSTLKADGDATATRLADSVRQLTALRARAVPACPTPAGGADGPAPGAAGDSELAEATRQATSACLTDSARLAALQQFDRARSQHP